MLRSTVIPYLFVDLFQIGQDRSGDRRIEARHRFIGQQKQGFLVQGAGDRNPLLFSSRQGVGALVGLVQNINTIEALEGFQSFPPAEDVKERRDQRFISQISDHDIFQNGETLDQVEMLEDHADSATVEPQFLRVVSKSFIFKYYFPCRGISQVD